MARPASDYRAKRRGWAHEHDGLDEWRGGAAKKADQEAKLLASKKRPQPKTARDIVIERGMGMTADAIMLGRLIDRPIPPPLCEISIAEIHRTHAYLGARNSTKSGEIDEI